MAALSGDGHSLVALAHVSVPDVRPDGVVLRVHALLDGVAWLSSQAKGCQRCANISPRSACIMPVSWGCTLIVGLVYVGISDDSEEVLLSDGLITINVAHSPEEALLPPVGVPAVLDEPVVHPVLCCAIPHNHHRMVQRICAASRNVYIANELLQVTGMPCLTQCSLCHPSVYSRKVYC